MFCARRLWPSIAVLVIVLSAGCGSSARSAPAASEVVPSSATDSSGPALWRIVDVPKGSSGGQWIALETFDGQMLTAQVSRPAATGPWPVVIVLHGDGGLRQDSLDLASQFAAAGFLSVTPCWQGYTEADATQSGVPVGIGCAVDAPTRDTATAVMKDLSAIAVAARTLPGARQGVGLLGHSAGGTAAALTSALGGKVDAVVAISGAYGCGQILTRWGTCLPQQVEGLRTPLLIVHGVNDTQSNGTRIDVVRTYESLAREKGKDVQTLYVDGAPHELPYSSYWNEVVRGKVLAFLRQTLTR